MPVPVQLGVAAGARAVEAVTRRDLARDDLVSWVRSQLIVEGPTAREAMLVTAQDDLARWPNFWLYSRRSKADPIERTYRSELPGTYDPTHDYGPWRELEVGIVTAVLGAPALIALAGRRRIAAP
ncbi:hypothetical protein Psuf_062020 [Phytohabitans suffuscus]|uniref:Uncharacterized protein n=1 Tax=Phytohabitans suffuscus TaxID=624315 RepID=A0A6F8YS49_9ACTN|nr:hypothetical protein Psuf_062020 [Phytohabitans suffuscus]